jgi:hypothetical protein
MRFLFGTRYGNRLVSERCFVLMQNKATWAFEKVQIW